MEPGEYDHQAIEAAARALWEAHDVYRYDRDGHGPVFSVDTPPPYVSAAHLHVGHAMSYSQPDFIVRYRRMRGERVFYPIGFDDNGLPTERYVEQAYGVRAVDMPRAEFVALCLAETQRTAGRYEDLWRRLGLSVDWSLRYSTIDARCQRTAQASFIALHEAGHLRRAQDPILWCPLDQTSLAQADTEDLERTSRLHTIDFGAGLQIATTRPELLPACVALYHHPADPRYAGLTAARVPLFGYEVPVLADEDVDPEYGTGLMMVCTFGDSEDVLRWRRDHLALRLVLGPDGRLGELAGPFAGLTVTQGRSAVVKALEEAGLLAGSVPVRQVVGVHERCQTPVEFQIRPQWFIAVREHADRFRARAAELEWIPPFMRRRLEDWIDGLKWDWNITRQRRYGVPFPVWFCASCDAPVLARAEDLPVDPLTDTPPAAACPSCGAVSSRRPGRDGHLDDLLAVAADQRRVGDGRHRSGAGPDVHAGAGVRDHPDLAVLLRGAVRAAVRPGAVAHRADLRLGAERAGQEAVQARPGPLGRAGRLQPVRAGRRDGQVRRGRAAAVGHPRPHRHRPAVHREGRADRPEVHGQAVERGPVRVDEPRRLRPGGSRPAAGGAGHRGPVGAVAPGQTRSPRPRRRSRPTTTCRRTRPPPGCSGPSTATATSR